MRYPAERLSNRPVDPQQPSIHAGLRQLVDRV